LFVDEGFCFGFAEYEEFAVGGDDVGHGFVGPNIACAICGLVRMNL
jgi:hypothetical protein